MEHVTLIQCPIEDTTEHGGLLTIFREFLYHGRVLLEDQVKNPYSLTVVCKDVYALATAPLIIFRRGSVSIHDEST
jgi:hypothetical protein